MGLTTLRSKDGTLSLTLDTERVHNYPRIKMGPFDLPQISPISDDDLPIPEYSGQALLSSVAQPTATHSKKKKKKKKKKQQKDLAPNTAAQNGTANAVVNNSMNFLNPKYEYPASRVINQSPNGDVIVRGFDPLSSHSVASAAAAAAAASSSSRKTTCVPSSKKKKEKDNIWNTSTQEEQFRLKDFWQSLSESERRNLVKVKKESVLRTMKEQQRSSCSCSKCGRKRLAIEEELEVLYDTYYGELESGNTVFPLGNGNTNGNSGDNGNRNQSNGNANDYHTHSHSNTGNIDHDSHTHTHTHSHTRLQDDYQSEDESYNDQNPESSFFESYFNFSNGLTSQDGVMTVADDLLKNDGQKFIDLIEKLAQRRISGEENETLNEDEIEDGNQYCGDDVEEEEEEEDDDDDAEYDDADDDDNLTEEQRMEEGRRMFQLFTTRLFHQRILTAYRERVAEERTKKLLEELDEEERLKKEKEQKKLKDKERKKDKKRQQRLQREQERLQREKEKEEAEERQREESKKKQEEIRKKKEQQRLKREAERKLQEEEKRRKSEEAKKRMLEQQERVRKEKEALEKKKKAEKEAIELKLKQQKIAKERKAQELKLQKDKEARKLNDLTIAKGQQEQEDSSKTKNKVKGLPNMESLDSSNSDSRQSTLSPINTPNNDHIPLLAAEHISVKSTPIQSQQLLQQLYSKPPDAAGTGLINNVNTSSFNNYLSLQNPSPSPHSSLVSPVLQMPTNPIMQSPLSSNPSLQSQMPLSIPPTGLMNQFASSTGASVSNMSMALPQNLHQPNLNQQPQSADLPFQYSIPPQNQYSTHPPPLPISSSFPNVPSMQKLPPGLTNRLSISGLQSPQASSAWNMPPPGLSTNQFGTFPSNSPMPQHSNILSPINNVNIIPQRSSFLDNNSLSLQSPVIANPLTDLSMNMGHGGTGQNFGQAHGSVSRHDSRVGDIEGTGLETKTYEELTKLIDSTTLLDGSSNASNNGGSLDENANTHEMRQETSNSASNLLSGINRTSAAGLNGSSVFASGLFQGSPFSSTIPSSNPRNSVGNANWGSSMIGTCSSMPSTIWSTPVAGPVPAASHIWSNGGNRSGSATSMNLPSSESNFIRTSFLNPQSQVQVPSSESIENFNVTNNVW